MFELLRVALMSALGGAILGLAIGLSSPLMARGRRSLAAKRAKYGFWKAWGVEIGEYMLGGVIIGVIVGFVMFHRGEFPAP